MTSPARSGLVSRSTSHRSAVLALSWLLVPFFVAGGMLSSLRQITDLIDTLVFDVVSSL